MGATFLHVRELELEDKESERLAKAILHVFSAWGVPELSDKSVALFELVGAGVTIYGTRLAAIANRKRAPGRPGPAIPPIPTGSVYQDAARSSQAAQQAQPQGNPQPRPTAQPGGLVARPNGPYVQAPTSPFGDADGMELG